MKIEIDLTKLGFHYDADGDPTNNTLEDAIVAAAATKLISEHASALRTRIVEEVNAVARERITAVVDEVLAGPIQETTPWGESTKPVTTVREIVRKALEDYLNKPVQHDRYSSLANREPQNLRELVQQQTTNVLNKELVGVINKAKAEVHGLLRDKAIRAAADAIAKG